MNTTREAEGLNVRAIASKALVKLGGYYNMVSVKYGRKGKIAFGIGTLAVVVGTLNMFFSFLGWAMGMFIVPVIVGALGFLGWKYGAPRIKKMMEDE
ncbi:MAG: hypothetical protein Q8R36_02440 [bacterium]|nr:hypothetical protein [bacterium]